MDSLHANFMCVLNPECSDFEGHREDLFYQYNSQLINCFLDSLIKEHIPLSKIGAEIMNYIPISSFTLSQESINIIKNEPDSCEREVWMLGLSEKKLVVYKFENICKIKKFEKRIPSMQELNEYWRFEYEDEVYQNMMLMAERVLKESNVKESYSIGTCSGKVISSSVQGFDVELLTSKSCFVDTIFEPFFFERKEKDLIYLKVIPLTRMVYDSLHSMYDLPPRINANSKTKELKVNDINQMTVAWIKRRSFLNNMKKNKTFFNGIKKGERIFLEIPCFDDSVALSFYPFHTTKTKYPYLLCEIEPANRDY